MVNSITTANEDISAEQTILSVAEKLFLEKGYALTSTADIAREAECNSALIHYYFRTKERLFLAIFEQKVSLLASALFALPLETLSFNEKIESVIKTHFEFIGINRKLPFLLLNELTTNPERRKFLKEAMFAKVEPFVAALQREIEVEVSKNNIRKMVAIDLLMNIAVLNVSTFLVLPIMGEVEGFDEEYFIAHRREEILHTIITSLKP